MGVPAGLYRVGLTGQGGVGGEIFYEYGQAPKREPAAPVIGQVDAVEALEVCLQGVGIVAD